MMSPRGNNTGQTFEESGLIFLEKGLASMPRQATGFRASLIPTSIPRVSRAAETPRIQFSREARVGR